MIQHIITINGWRYQNTEQKNIQHHNNAIWEQKRANWCKLMQLVCMQYSNCENTYISYNVVENLENHLMTRQIFEFFVRLTYLKCWNLRNEFNLEKENRTC